MITILAAGDKGVLGSPEHRLLQRMLDATGAAFYPAGRGASATQLRALERKGYAVLVREGQTTVIGAHLTARGERHLERLNAAQAHAERAAEMLKG